MALSPAFVRVPATAADSTSIEAIVPVWVKLFFVSAVPSYILLPLPATTVTGEVFFVTASLPGIF